MRRCVRRLKGLLSSTSLRCFVIFDLASRSPEMPQSPDIGKSVSAYSYTDARAFSAAAWFAHFIETLSATISEVIARYRLPCFMNFSAFSQDISFSCLFSFTYGWEIGIRHTFVFICFIIIFIIFHRFGEMRPSNLSSHEGIFASLSHYFSSISYFDTLWRHASARHFH